MGIWIIENWETIVSIASICGSIIVAIIYLIRRLITLKGAKTTAERDAILAELKSNAYGLVAVAEQMFSDIPKSGSSKLLYVLNHIKTLCEEKNIEFCEDTWKEFIEGIVGASNDVITAKETEKAISGYIDKVKEEIPYFIADADKLFEVIPDSKAYKIEYILKLVSKACDKHAINVYELYDWRVYINELYNEQIGA